MKNPLSNDIQYSLLEVIENPSRIKSIPHDRLFKYVEESIAEQSRFERLINMLETNYFGLFLGLVFDASDLLPLDTIFEKQLNSNIMQNSKPIDNATELNVFNKIIDLFINCMINSDKQKDSLFRYMNDVLYEDGFIFCRKVLKKENHEQLFNAFKLMYERKHLNPRVWQYFSFCMNRKFEQSTAQTQICVPLLDYKILVCIGGKQLYDFKNINKDVTSEYTNVVKYINYLSRDFSSDASGKRIKFPFVFLVYIDQNNLPVIFVTTSGYFLGKNVKTYHLTEQSLTVFINNGVTALLCVDKKNNIVSFMNQENKMLTQNSFKVKTIDCIVLPMVLSGKAISIYICTDENDNKYIIYGPNLNQTNISDFVGHTIHFISLSNSYFLQYFE